jgi:hypothetical protein
MPGHVERRTVDLSGYPDLVVIYLGMRLRGWAGLKTLLMLGPQIDKSVAARPAGLLLHEPIYYSFIPLHVGMRQYWRDFDALERWSRSEPHRIWWKNFLRDSGGTGFWHETYFMGGGMEAVYDDVNGEIGLLKFAPQRPARGGMFAARDRARRGGAVTAASALTEAEIYGNTGGSARADA